MWEKVASLTFKVNFINQKLSEYFRFFSIEEYHFKGMFIIIVFFWKLNAGIPKSGVKRKSLKRNDSLNLKAIYKLGFLESHEKE